jgi:redox-sensitive bicupin YhaK (pirin superfamily)
LTSRGDGARVVLYLGQPQREPIIHHGPFVAADQADLLQLFEDYRAGQFVRMSQLSARAARE